MRRGTRSKRPSRGSDHDRRTTGADRPADRGRPRATRATRSRLRPPRLDRRGRRADRAGVDLVAAAAPIGDDAARTTGLGRHPRRTEPRYRRARSRPGHPGTAAISAVTLQESRTRRSPPARIQRRRQAPRPSPSPSPTPSSTPSRCVAGSSIDRPVAVRRDPRRACVPGGVQRRRPRDSDAATGPRPASTSPSTSPTMRRTGTAGRPRAEASCGSPTDKGQPRRVAVIEGPRTTYPVVSDWSPDRSRALVAVAHGSADGGKPDCVELFEVRIDDGAATRLWAETFDPGTWTADTRRTRVMSTPPVSPAVSWPSTRHPVMRSRMRSSTAIRTTVGLVIDGADRTMRVQIAHGAALSRHQDRAMWASTTGSAAVVAGLPQSRSIAPGVWSPERVHRLALTLRRRASRSSTPLAGTGRAIRNRG